MRKNLIYLIYFLPDINVFRNCDLRHTKTLEICLKYSRNIVHRRDFFYGSIFIVQGAFKHVRSYVCSVNISTDGCRLVKTCHIYRLLGVDFSSYVVFPS